jgi:dipeptidase E
MNIVAIGGGEIRLKETLPIDRFICQLTQKAKPNALFIPTASGDPDGYCETFDRIYGAELGCTTDHLKVVSEQTDIQTIRKKIRWADLIYVGGGNTRAMIQRWTDLGVDKEISEAGKRGCVLSGISAGAICWFHSGLSDSDSFSGDDDWAFSQVAGLDLAPEVFCPHLDAEQRHEPFMKLMNDTEHVGLAADNGAAVWIHNGKYRAMTCLPEAKVYLYRKLANGVDVTSFLHDDRLPLGTLV